MTTIFDYRTLTTRKRAVHALAGLDGMLIDVGFTCDQMSEQITEDVFDTDNEDCLREAAELEADLGKLCDRLMQFQAKYGEVA